MEVAAAAAVATVASSVFYTKRNSDIQKKQYKNAMNAANKDYELSKQQAKLALEEEQRKNRSLLAQQQSAYKAKLGASGLSSQKGSGQVVLDTMKKEHDIEDKYLVNQANISLEALLNGINQTSSRNLLSMSAASNNNTMQAINGLSSFTNLGRTIIK